MLRAAIRMLVAEDALMVHNIFREAARRTEWPIQIVEAFNGDNCLELLSRGDIQLAFIDVHMPGMSGVEALWGARSQGIETFVTLMSGPDSDRFLEAARRLRAYDFLFKPFHVAEVEAIIRTFGRMAAPMRALIVDDSQTVRRIVQKVLIGTRFNLVMEEAPDGESALARCLTGEFDIVFLDYRMPGLNGIETLEQLLERHPTLKVVMISGESNAERERRALRSGAAAFLHKPFYARDIDALLNEIYSLRTPKVLTIGNMTRDFDVAISGRRVAVVHRPTGHIFEYLWYPEPPYLRHSHIRANVEARMQAQDVRDEAESAALLELRAANLVALAA